MQAWHYITRGCIPLRYSVINVNCQCVGCNIFKKGNYPIYSIKMMQLHWDNILYELNEIEKESKANPQKYGRDYYQKIIKLYS